MSIDLAFATLNQGIEREDLVNLRNGKLLLSRTCSEDQRDEV